MKPWITVTHSDPEVTSLSVTCVSCASATEINASTNGLAAWRDGALIQNALPDLSTELRELLMSGTCDPCFEAMFSAEEK